MHSWPPRLREDRQDTSLRASVADLLDALTQARQDRDRLAAEVRRRDRRIEALESHLDRARETAERLAMARPRRRVMAADNRQVRLFDEAVP